MRKTILIISIIILLGFVSSLCYWSIFKASLPGEIPEVLTPEEPKVPSAQFFTLSGEVKEITDNSLIITTKDEVLEVLISEGTEFFITITTQEKGIAEEKEDEIVKPTPIEGEKIESKDIKIGDEVNIFTKKENGELIGVSVLILSPK